MWSVNQQQFEYALRQFVEEVLVQQDRFNYQTTAIAFDSGYLYEQEWYKRGVWLKSRDYLKTSSWKKEMISKGYLVESVNNCLNAAISGGKQSLINWRDCAYIRNQFAARTEESERVLYQLFTGDDDAEEFDDALGVWGINFPAITFLFFLKDRSRYLPIRPMLFARSFKRMGITTDCTKQCTWDNYMEFMEIMKWIQYQLMILLDDTAELLDAHTFVSMMNDIPDEEPTADSADILAFRHLDSVVVTGDKANRHKEYYVTRYEDMPQNREAAIAAHGFKCKACGMDFAGTYGSIGRNFIEVHHITPLSEPKQEVEIDAQHDLVCLCANCHRMIHRRRNAIMAVEELQQWLAWGGVMGSHI